MKKIVGKMSRIFIPAVISLFLFSSIASAHVTVTPNTSTTGAWETYTLKVPVEKNVATTKVTVKAPAGIEIMSYQPVAGWKYSADKDSSGKVRTFTFEATGEGIQAGQFQQFVFVAKNPDKATKAAWDAFQYYKDGSVVEWTGDENSDSPHSITDIVTATSTDHHDSQPAAHEDKKPAETTTEKSKSNNALPIAAIAISAVALVLSLRKRG
ncbi:DUF1775 domain-containing protein [Bacillus salipaludis]|uniref:DUF1775 domain-containing protein n=1 Tax=Bacillus salipaludis TaxID=2547811 RepID=A0A4R5VZJ8_9BACI|nr:DUF1775 domain-containing protein [Bacillus salipaludis]MDQ6596711.1 DUF1775 domain-containing protein [Bacillus salipaludis]TDK65066.1 DUF1775 domain-containing protein [Bacillus salipaludis]